MRRHMPRLFALLAVSALACGDDVIPEVSPPTPDLKGDRDAADHTYHTVDGEPLLADAHLSLDSALAELARVAVEGSSGRQRRLAAETLARIEAGMVLIGDIARARGMDLWHMCKDLDGHAACAGDPPADDDWSGDDTLREALADSLDGYMWGDRLYFRFDEALDPSALAATLVHEVNHVLNRSECSYYEDYFAHEVDPTLAFLEEYRAFVVECVFRRGANGTASRCDGWANAQLEERDYGFVPDLSLLIAEDEDGTRTIAESLFDDDGRFGWLAPVIEVWPSDFAECETP